MAQRKKKKKLNDQQKLFCEEYVNNKGLNGTDAAIAAKYSEKTACSQASTLLRNPNVQEYIAELKAKRAEVTGFSAQKLLQRLLEESTANIKDLYNDDNTLKPIKEWPDVWCQGLIAGIETEAITIGKGKDKQTIGHTTKLKLANRTKLLELLGKHVDIQAFVDKLDVSGTITLESIVSTANQNKELEAKDVTPLKVVNDKPE